MTPSFTFGKKEKMTSELAIQALFKSGQSGFSFPLKYLTKIEEAEIGSVKILLTVPKRIFKHATDRNRMKRLIREAYRLAKHPLVEMAENQKLKIEIAFIYVVKEKTDFAHMQHSMNKIVANLSQIKR